MKIFITANADGRIIQYGSTKSNETDIEIEVSDNHEVIRNPFVYKLVEGELVKDEAYQQELIEYKDRLTPLEQTQKDQAELTFLLMMSGVL
ncbi:hypothetical protein J7E63_12870 [Bacillus sp. ISL-75]|uniref:hypothetical protein n=1 Tax=Bacillus sp. ISL-75 TaxID=2819137 RepID=UPI001BEA757A|nr:hypothetical protein [Bacillus sp. ISL-75]MBT2727831.1 hypothetical protein [Bacillus sp. ISL-75]